MFGLVLLRFGLAKFGFAMFGSEINGIGHSDAASKISAQLDLIWHIHEGPPWCRGPKATQCLRRKGCIAQRSLKGPCHKNEILVYCTV